MPKTVTQDDELKQLAARAAQLVGDVPEALQGVAFQKIFDALMAEWVGASGNSGQTDATGNSNRARPSDPTTAKSQDRLSKILNEADRTKYPQVTIGRKALDLALLVLQLARDDFATDWLMPSEISRVLGEKFRLRATPAAIRMAISESTYVNRRRRPDGNYEYSLMQGGEAYLATAPTGAGSTSPSKKRGRAKAPREKVEVAATLPDTGDSRKVNAVISTRPRGVRRSPMQLVAQLISEGFFATPRMIGHVIEHLEHKKAHKLKATDLSPTLVRLIRRGDLTRAKNANGQYEYAHK